MSRSQCAACRIALIECGLDLDENTAAVEDRDGEPADRDKSDRIEQRGKSLVWDDIRNRPIEHLLEIYSLARMDAAQRRLQEFGEDIGRYGVGAEYQEWTEEAGTVG